MIRDIRAQRLPEGPAHGAVAGVCEGVTRHVPSRAYMTELTEVFATCPEDIQASLRELGWSKQVLSDWDAGVAAWDKVREIQPDFPELDIHYPVAVMRR